MEKELNEREKQLINLAQKCFENDPVFFYNHYDQLLEIVRGEAEREKVHKSRVMTLSLSDPSPCIRRAVIPLRQSRQERSSEIIVLKQFSRLKTSRGIMFET